METKTHIPRSLRVAIAGLGVFAVVHLVVGLSNPVQLIACFANIILLAGLYRG